MIVVAAPVADTEKESLPAPRSIMSSLLKVDEEELTESAPAPPITLSVLVVSDQMRYFE
jgi:hypothetical protein